VDVELDDCELLVVRDERDDDEEDRGELRDVGALVPRLGGLDEGSELVREFPRLGCDEFVDGSRD